MDGTFLGITNRPWVDRSAVCAAVYYSDCEFSEISFVASCNHQWRNRFRSSFTALLADRRRPDGADSWLSGQSRCYGAVEVSLTFGIPAILNEFVDIVGPITAAWALISWPRLQRLVPPLLNTPLATSTESIPIVTSLPEQSSALLKPAWRVTLPSELGDELIAVCSELQYLRVWTDRGSALVLGALQQVEDSEGSSGVRTHRSWWVNARYIIRVRVKRSGAVCELSNGLEVPVSRRRKADLLTRFGSSADYNSEEIASISPLTDSNQNIRRKPSCTDTGL